MMTQTNSPTITVTCTSTEANLLALLLQRASASSAQANQEDQFAFDQLEPSFAERLAFMRRYYLAKDAAEVLEHDLDNEERWLTFRLSDVASHFSRRLLDAMQVARIVDRTSQVPAVPSDVSPQQPVGKPDLTPVEFKAVALCLRYLQREVREWGCDEMDMVPPFTQKEMVELKNAVYAQDGDEPVTEDEEYLEELSLSSLYAYLLKRIGADVPELEG